MMAKSMKAQTESTESTDPVLSNTDYISKLKKNEINETNSDIILM